MSLMNEIEILLKESFTDAEVSISDLTGTGDHLEIDIKSERFSGLNLLKQHRLVMDVLKKPLGENLHAVKLKTSTRS